MKNLIYAIEQLGGTPTCDYSQLSGQPTGTPVVVTVHGSEDTEVNDLGVGINTASGQTAVYLGKEGSTEDNAGLYGILKYESNSTNSTDDVMTLFNYVNALAEEYLAGPKNPVAVVSPDGTTANFTDVASGLAVSFTDTSVPASGATIASWWWNFGDHSGTSKLQNPSHTYPLPGTYRVELDITDSHGEISKIWKSVAVAAPAPTPAPTPAPAAAPAADGTASNFTATASDLSVTFTDTSVPGTGFTITGWSWNFGDGSPADTTQNPTHVYSASGTYLVELDVTDSNAQTAKSYQYVSVIAAVPADSPAADGTVASFTTSINGRTVTFTDTSSPGTGYQLSKWNWNFDDAAGTSSAQNPTYTYAMAGTYTVELDVVDSNGQTAKAYNRITIA